VGRILGVLAAVAVVLGAAEPAAGQARFFGTTSAAGDVEFFSHRDRAVGARVEWRARCRGRVPYEHDVTSLAPPKYAARGGEFAAVTAYEHEEDAGYDVEVEAAMTGRRRFDRRRPGAEQWAGRFEVEVVVRAPATGRVLERCRSRAMRWRVWREAYGTGRWTMAGEPGDWILGGDAVSYDARNSEIVAYGDDQTVLFAVEGRDGDYWNAEFSVPEGSRLRAGRRYVEIDDELPGSTGHVDVSGQHRSCGSSVGEFTVRSARFDRRRRMRSITIDFEQRCYTGSPALRGTLSWKARLR
jgi:hypothetical protein